MLLAKCASRMTRWMRTFEVYISASWGKLILTAPLISEETYELENYLIDFKLPSYSQEVLQGNFLRIVRIKTVRKYSSSAIFSVTDQFRDCRHTQISLCWKQSIRFGPFCSSILQVKNQGFCFLTLGSMLYFSDVDRFVNNRIHTIGMIFYSGIKRSERLEKIFHPLT